MKRLKALLTEFREAIALLKNLHADISTLRSEIAAFRLDVNALRVAQSRERHRQAASAEPETLGRPYGLTKEQSEQVDWSRVR